MNEPIELNGARLRPLRSSDMPALFDYLSDSAVTELTCYPAISRTLIEEIVERSQSRWAAGEVAKWGITINDDKVIGTCGFNEWSPSHRRAELAYDLARPFWGRGIMHRAVNAVLDRTFRQHEIDRVQAYVRTDNFRSERLLERFGFVREGCLRRYRICRGQPHDFCIFGLLRTDWTKPSQ